MTKPSLRLNLLLVLVPLVALSFLNAFNTDKPTVSVLENRALKTMPTFTVSSFFSGQYLREYEDYFADTFIFRDSFVALSKKVEGVWSLDSSTPTLVTHKGGNVSDDQTAPALEQPKPEEPMIHAEVDTSKSLLIFNSKAMELHRFSEHYSRYYADFLNTISARVDQVKMYSLLVPTQVEFLRNEKYRSLSSSQLNTINYINQHLDDGINRVDAYSALNEHSDEYIYFSTDHHWTALGAYYAYTAFMDAQGQEPVPLEKYDTDYASPFLGYLYSACLHETVKNNPDAVHFYKPFVAHEYYYYKGQSAVQGNVLEMRWAQDNNKYGIFLGGDRPWGVIKTEVQNGKSIVVVKDSYGNAFVPFLLPHYEEIYIIDPRQFQHNLIEFIADRQIQEALFLNYMMVTEHEGFTDLLIRIRDQR